MKGHPSGDEEKVLIKFYRKVIRETVIPLLLIIVTVNAAIALPYFVVHKNSHMRAIGKDGGVAGFVSAAWKSIKWTDLEIWTIVIVSGIWALISTLLPGQEYSGPPTVSGFIPTYTRSGFTFYVISMSAVVPMIWHVSVLHLYYKFVTFAGILTVVGLVFCIMLYIKGHFAPSPGVFGSSGSPVFDFYWGLELYPRIMDDMIDLKTAVNSRFGLWLWQVVVLVAWKANFELHQVNYARGEINWALTASTLLQTIYLAKFYYWEDGYMSTIDISVDKFGFYVGWGCIAWVPTFYTLSSVYLVKHSPTGSFGFISFLLTIGSGILMIYLNYEADRQRQIFRSTKGKVDIWGAPAKVIHAIYTSQDGTINRSVLLASGYWGMARHFNYAFELGAALCWALPALTSSLIPYLYFFFLSVLLIHRSFRDDEKCRIKYTKYWDEYCQLVPYRIIPYVF